VCQQSSARPDELQTIAGLLAHFGDAR